MMTIAEYVQIVATTIGILAGLLGLYKYFSDKRQKELREWQKVVIYKIFRQNEAKAMTFLDILARYRTEAQAFPAFDLKKSEISDDALRRVLIELTSSNILSMERSDSFRLQGIVKLDWDEKVQLVNQELVRMIASSPFKYTVDEFVKDVAPKIGMEIPILRGWIKKSIAEKYLEADDQNRLAFPP